MGYRKKSMFDPLSQTDLKTWIVRLLAAYLAVLGGYVWTKPELKFTDKTFGPEMGSLIGITLVVFLLITLIDLLVRHVIRVDGWILLGSALSYGAVLAFRANDTYTSVVVALLVCFAAAFLAKNEMLPIPLGQTASDKAAGQEQLPASEAPRWLAWTLVGVCFGLSALYIGSVTVIRYLNYASPNFDFGIFVNMFHNMATTGLPNTTCERDGFLSHFAVHFSPIYYLLLPFYWIFPSGITLQIGQAVILASGVIPLYRIVRSRNMSRLTAAGFCAVYVLFPALSGGCMYDIHENCFLAPLLLWTFDACLRDKKILTFVFALLTCFVKEDAPIYIAFFGLWVLFSEKDKKRKLFGGGLFAFAIAYFLGVSALMSAFGEGIMAWRYSDYSADGSLTSVILTVFRNPGLVLHHIGSEDKLKYIFQTLAPLCALPLMTTKPSRLVLLGPYILINLMPSYTYQHDIYFQYNFASFAFLILAAVLNFNDFKPQTRKVALPCAICASLILFCGTTFTSKYFYFTNYDKNEQLRADMAEAIAQIPEDASVVSSTFILPHVAYRSEIYPMTTKHMDKCEYAVVDLRYGKEIKNNPHTNDYGWLVAEGWEQIWFTQGTVAVFKNPSYAPGGASAQA